MPLGLTIPTTFTAGGNYLSQLDKMQKATGGFAKRTAELGSSLQSFGGKMALGSAAVLAPLGMAVNSAMDFEEAMAGVAKVAGFKIGDTEFQKLSEQAKELAPQLGLTATELSNIYADLAQGGVATKDLNSMAEVVGKLGVAFDLTSSEAGAMYMQTKNALGQTDDQVQHLMGVLNELDNKGTASARNLLNFMSMGGSGVARSLEINAETVAAFGSTLIGMGKDSSTASTNMEVFARTIKKGGEAANIFNKAGGGDKGILAVFEHASKLDTTKQNKFFQQFGAYGSDLQLLAKNYGQLTEMVKVGGDEQNGFNSVLGEFGNRSQTAAFKLKQANSEFENLKIVVGTELVPQVVELLKVITPMIKQFADYVKENPNTVKNVANLAARLFILGTAIAGVGTAMKAFAAFSAFTKLGMVAPIITFVAQTFGVLTGAMGIFEASTAALIAGTLLPFIAVIGGIIAVVYSLYSNWDRVVAAFRDGGILDGIWAIGKVLIDAILMPLQWILKGLDAIAGTNFSNMLQGVRDDMWAKEDKMTATNNQKTANENLRNSIVSGNANINVNVNDPKGLLDVALQSDKGSAMKVALSQNNMFGI